MLALEDLARLAERGIYKLQTWIEGMRYLPTLLELSACFRVLSFDHLPDIAMVTGRYRSIAKQQHRDNGGSNVQFIALQKAAEEAKRYLEEA
ncbi:hypothetical protein [Paenibacillus gorillae]|uniref:hypothetical protein n=1 Tax=Paenibacillus gorillae TaxID=1243662 RepID=UPI0004B9B9EF|nr:hypothetical protein [Paenibacillus gorillae]